MRSLEQERAKYAYSEISEISKDKEKATKVKPHIVSAPTYILKNGLIASLAFYLTKKDYKIIFELIHKWIQEHCDICKDKKDSEFIKCLSELDAIDLAYATDETLKMLNWAKMFAKSMIADEGGENESEE